MKLQQLIHSTILFSALICFLLALPLAAADAEVGLSNFRRDQIYEDGLFFDVAADDWFYQNVAEAYEYGLMKGDGAGGFAPNGSISIVETVVTACRLHNIYHGGTHVFASMHPWEAPYIAYAVENGLIGADEYDNYSAKATRAQFTAILANALPAEALPAINLVDDGAIPDVPVSAAYAEDAYLLYRAGIIIGDNTNSFHADRPISRAEVAAILTRMANPELRKSVALTVDDPFPLSYTRNADGKSWKITGCDSSVSGVNIPAKFNGLPVTAIDGAAFIGCNQLTEFTADADHPVFYTEDGVLFTDLPEKTLVRFPPAYSRTSAYIVPQGTVQIAPYAFAGIVKPDMQHELISITISDGVRSIGDYAFASYQEFQMFIYVPDSLTEIGRNLTQFSKGNIPFYVSSWDTAFAIYANKYNLPCGITKPNEPTDIPVPASHVPVCIPAMWMTEAEGDIVTVDIGSVGKRGYENLDIKYFYDFSEKQRDFDGEVRLLLAKRWEDAIPDAQGNTRTPYFTQTGIYGAGKTTGDAILRGYDLDGNLVCMQRVSGNFTFAFPGAYDLGVEGGTDTKLTVLPQEPIFLAEACDYPVYPETWHRLPDGNVSQLFVICEPFVTFTHRNTDERIWLSYMQLDSANAVQSFDLTPNYQIVHFFTGNSAYSDALKYSIIRFDAMQTLYSDADIQVMKKSTVSVPDNFAAEVDACWMQVKEAMVGTYFPGISDTYQIYVLVNEKHPTCGGNIINIGAETIRDTIIHEMVHAVDLYYPLQSSGLSPSAWLEGRADYIGDKITGYRGERYPDFDWTFISKEERADFFHYFYFSINRNTTYSVGYLFFKYLCDTYGEDVSLHISENIGAVTAEMMYGKSDEEKALIFKKCVTDATDETVFQDFVRNVIEG